MAHTPKPWKRKRADAEPTPEELAKVNERIAPYRVWRSDTALCAWHVLGPGLDMSCTSWLSVKLAAGQAKNIYRLGQESAAPDMLEALKAMTTRYVDLVNSGDAGCWDPEQIDEVKLARAAITKAEGRS